MSPVNPEHPLDEVVALVENELDKAAAVRVNRHLATCGRCSRLADELRSVSAALRSEVPSEAPERLVASILRETIGAGRGRRVGISIHWVWPRLAAAAVITAAAALIFFHVYPRVPHAVPHGEVRYARAFEPVLGGSSTFPTSEAAAMYALRVCIVSENGRMHFTTPSDSTSTGDVARRLTVSIVGGSRKLELHGMVPLQTDRGREPVAHAEAWLAFFDEARPQEIGLQRFSMLSNKVAFDWHPSLGLRGWLTFTYPSPDGFRSTECQPFDLEP